MLFNYVLQHNLNCPFHFLPDQTKQKSCISINVMLGSRARTQFSICFNQRNSFAPVFMIESNRLYFYFSEVPIILHSVIFVAFNFIRNTPHNKICNIMVEEYGLKSFIYK